MLTTTVIPMKWALNLIHDNTMRCVCCNKRISGEPRWVEVIDGGANVARPGSEVDQNDPGYMAFHPIGITCAKKYFHGFTHYSIVKK